MNRLFSLLLISLFTLVICGRTLSRPTSDEETLKNLEMESAKHPGYGESDVTFQKSILGDHFIFIDPLGHVYDQTSADFEKMAVGIRTQNPDATVTYSGIYTTSGFKDPNANVPGAHFVAVDTWQKQSGKWKFLAGAAVSTEPIPADAYKAPAPGSN
jgi:hypothetical protein